MTNTPYTALPTSDTRYAGLDTHLLPQAGFLDLLAVFGQVLLPTIAKGVILRRPGVLAVAERLDLDRRAVRRMQRIREKYRPGPVLLRVPGRVFALVLEPDHVHRVLAQTPDPFSPASAEKRAALSHFEPKQSLISRGTERIDRRRLNEEALESDRPVHCLGDRFLDIVEAEVSRLIVCVDQRRELNWNLFSQTWFRIVRRVVFGDSARDDHHIWDLMTSLRADANWAFLRPKRPGARAELFARIRRYLERAEPGSLAAMMSQAHPDPRTAPEQQVPQWLFAFDPAGMATFRTLALIASHSEAAARLREEIGSRLGAGRQYMPYARALVLESIRLWPTTPLLLRENTTPVLWESGMMPANTSVVIYTPFFHRDDQRLPFADRLAPEVWMEDPPAGGWPLVPFSAGPAVCPGSHLVLMLTSAVLAAVLDRADVRLLSHRWMGRHRPLPGTLNHFGLRFALSD